MGEKNMWTTEAIINAKNKTIGSAMIKDNLLENDRWLIRGILAIFERQTSDERNSEQTHHNNGIGFGAVDAQILTSFAKQIISWQKRASDARYPNPLSRTQLALARRKMLKYSGQLFQIATQKVTETVSVE